MVLSISEFAQKHVREVAPAVRLPHQAVPDGSRFQVRVVRARSSLDHSSSVKNKQGNLGYG